MSTRSIRDGNLALVALGAVSPVYAQETAAAATANVAQWSIITAGFALAFAAGLARSAGRAVSAAVESIARNPSAAGEIRGNLLLGLVLIESLAIYVLLDLADPVLPQAVRRVRSAALRPSNDRQPPSAAAGPSAHALFVLPPRRAAALHDSLLGQQLQRDQGRAPRDAGPGFNCLRMALGSFVCSRPSSAGATGSAPSSGAWIERRLARVSSRSALIGHAYTSCFFMAGVARTSVANSSLIFGCTPITVALLSASLGHERPGRALGRRALSLAGIYLVVGQANQQRRVSRWRRPADSRGDALLGLATPWDPDRF